MALGNYSVSTKSRNRPLDIAVKKSGDIMYRDYNEKKERASSGLHNFSLSFEFRCLSRD